MKAMILAAGLGTRLRPLTNYKPKALVEVGEMPLLEIAIRRLKYFGFQDIIINVHHFAEQIIGFLEKNEHFDINIQISDERDQLLNTGGGLKHAAHFFDDGQPFLLCNTDILSNIDLKLLYEQHVQSGAIATLATRSRATSRYLIFNGHDQLHGWVNVKSGKMIACRKANKNLQLMAFSGIHVINPALFEFMPQKDMFSIIDVYLEVAAEQDILSYPHDGDFWLDVGKKDALAKAEELAKELPIL